jgi:hypothetical protein
MVPGFTQDLTEMSTRSQSETHVTTDGQSVCLDVEPLSDSQDQMFVAV